MRKIIFVFLLLIGSNFLWAQEMTIYVAPEMIRCKGMLEVQCFQIKDSPNKDYDIFVASIDGFNRETGWEEGYNYKLLVTKGIYENSPANNPSVYFKLIKILSKTLPNDTLVIANRKSTCEDTKIFDCLLYKQKNEKEWHNLYGKIKGFKYREGYEYELLVSKKLNDNMGAGRTYEYTLIKTLSKKPTMVISDKNYAALNGQNYVLTGLDMDGSFNNDIGKTKAFITFNLDENRVNGNDGCNTFFGRVEFNNSKVSFGNLGSTQMACPDNKIWNYIPSNLNKADRYKVSGTTLKFYKGKKLLLEYELKIESEEIDKRKFALTSLIQNGTTKTVGDTKAYITFNISEGKVYGNDGCNTFSGKMNLNGNDISFSDFVSTKIACDNDMLDIAIYNDLKMTNKYKISNGVLKFYKDNAPMMEYRLIMEDVMPEKNNK
ncbi:MAG: DUF4377 domain-containing protein [Bacteroidetes bacterium]|nr:DUF4377 domain-containing protein [Bacteroidota bacterium]